MQIRITYCGECNFLPMAEGLQEAIRRRYAVTPELLDLGNGFFFVDVDGERIYNNQETYGFPTDEEIFARIDARRG